MVVVTDTILVAGRGSSRLNPPDEVLLGKHPEGVVNRLSRNGSDLGANLFSDVIRGAVGAV
jgi:hypothetical protein